MFRCSNKNARTISLTTLYIFYLVIELKTFEGFTLTVTIRLVTASVVIIMEVVTRFISSTKRNRK